MRCKKSGSAEGTYEEVEVLVYEIGLGFMLSDDSATKALFEFVAEALQ